MKTNEQFQRIITRNMDDDQIIELYKKLVRSEFIELQDAETLPEKIKEACDVSIVCEPLIRLTKGRIERSLYQGLAMTCYDYAYGLGVDFTYALGLVIESNFSKFILASELTSAQKHFNDLGIKVRFEQLEDEYYGAFSFEDQTVNGKYYELDKLLKGPNYKEVDESIEWWK